MAFMKGLAMRVSADWYVYHWKVSAEWICLSTVSSQVLNVSTVSSHSCKLGTTCEILDWAILDGSFYCMPFTFICVHEYSGLGPVLLSCFLTWVMGVVGHEDTESLLYMSCNPAHLCVPWPHPCHTPCSCIGGGMCSPKLPCTPLAEVLAMFLSYLNIMLIFH